MTNTNLFKVGGIDDVLTFNGETLALRLSIIIGGKTFYDYVDLEVDAHTSPAWKHYVGRLPNDLHREKLIENGAELVTKDELKKNYRVPNISSYKMLVDIAVKHIIDHSLNKPLQEAFYSGKAVEPDYNGDINNFGLTVRTNGEIVLGRTANPDDKTFLMQVMATIQEDGRDVIQEFRGIVHATNKQLAQRVAMVYFIQEYKHNYGDIQFLRIQETETEKYRKRPVKFKKINE